MICIETYKSMKANLPQYMPTRSKLAYIRGYVKYSKGNKMTNNQLKEYIKKSDAKTASELAIVVNARKILGGVK